MIKKYFLGKSEIMLAFTAARVRLARNHGALVDERAFKLNIKPEKLKDKSIKKTATAGRNNQLIAKNVADVWKLVTVKDTSRDVARKALVTSIRLLAEHEKRKVLLKDILPRLENEVLDNIWESGTNSYCSKIAIEIFEQMIKSGKAKKISDPITKTKPR